MLFFATPVPAAFAAALHWMLLLRTCLTAKRRRDTLQAWFIYDDAIAHFNSNKGSFICEALARLETSQSKALTDDAADM
jgi:hypothetical protein